MQLLICLFFNRDKGPFKQYVRTQEWVGGSEKGNFSLFYVLKMSLHSQVLKYSEVPNRRADRNKRAGLEKSATLLAYLLSKLINKQGGIFRLLLEKMLAGWKENLKNLSEHALLLGTSEYDYLPFFKKCKFNFVCKQ